MIKFIHIGSQIYEGERQFGFWSTCTDAFIKVYCKIVFNSWYDFESCHGYCSGEFREAYSLERFKSLMPEGMLQDEPEGLRAVR